MFIRKGRFYSLTILALLLFTLGGCGGNEQAEQSAEQALPALKVGMMPITDNLPFWLAEEKGYFVEEGLDVELIAFPSALERDSAFTAGQIDTGIGDMLAVAAMNNAGTEVRAVAVGQGATPGENRFAILSAPNSGITSPQQLKNVPIAMSLNTINEYLTDRLLQARGLQSGEIAKNSIPKLPLRLEALLNGGVKAATLPDPFATLAEIKGANLVVDNTENTVAQTVIIVRKATLDQNLVAMQKLMQAYARAVEDLQTDPLQYDKLIVEKARVPDEVLASSVHPLALHFTAPVLPDEAGVNETIQWMTEHQLLDKAFGYGDLVDDRVLK
ncbi:MAG: MetQ/NlpA family ABC transporter substrate-binding protein [Desulfotomaculaceae bacterium]